MILEAIAKGRVPGISAQARKELRSQNLSRLLVWHGAYLQPARHRPTSTVHPGHCTDHNKTKPLRMYVESALAQQLPRQIHPLLQLPKRILQRRTPPSCRSHFGMACQHLVYNQALPTRHSELPAIAPFLVTNWVCHSGHRNINGFCLSSHKYQ